MPKLHYTALSPEQMLERALGDRAEIAARPQRTPRQVLGMWMENAGAGFGIGVVVGFGLAWMGAPENTVWGTALGSGAIFFGVLMAWRGSADERALAFSNHRVRKAQDQINKQHAVELGRKQAQLNKALDALDEADDEIAQLRKALDVMTRERDMAIYDLTREREQGAQRSNGNSAFVTPRELAPQDVQDATRMVRHYYETGEHPSKDKSVDRWKWSEDRWKTAQSVLVDARVMAVNKTQAKWIAQSMDDAFRLLGEYMLHVKRLSVPTVNKTLGVVLYVESLDD